MKKSILCIILFMSGSVFAQEKDKSDPKIGFGVKAGITFPAFAISGATANGIATSSLTSFYGGIIVDIPFGSMLSVQPGLSLIGKGTSFSSGSIEKLTPLYVEVPINLIIGIEAGPGKFLVGGGPYWAWGISGKVKVAGAADKDLKFGSDATSDLKSMDWGLNFLLGYQLKFGLSINTGYSLGLTNVQPNAAIDATFKSGAFSAGLGFIF